MADYDFRTAELGNLNLKVTPEAQKIIEKVIALSQLGLPSVWIFEGDDGLEHYQTCESLLDVIDDVGGKLIRLGRDNIDLVRKESISSGCFLFQMD